MAGIQTGLTDAQLLASQLKAHELAGMNSSASEIDAVAKNSNEPNFLFDDSISFYGEQTIVLLGDSLTAKNGSTTSTYYTYSSGFFTWANALTGHKFKILKNAGIGGQTSTQILARVDADVIALAPKYCMFLCGMNDGVTDTNTATLKANIIAIYDKLYAAGIYSYILTNTTTLNYTEKNVQALLINKWLYEYFIDKPLCKIIDINEALINNASLTGLIKENVVSDNLHPSNNGGLIGGIEIAKYLKNYASKTIFPVSALDNSYSMPTSKFLNADPLQLRDLNIDYSTYPELYNVNNVTFDSGATNYWENLGNGVFKLNQVDSTNTPFLNTNISLTVGKYYRIEFEEYNYISGYSIASDALGTQVIKDAFIFKSYSTMLTFKRTNAPTIASMKIKSVREVDINHLSSFSVVASNVSYTCDTKERIDGLGKYKKLNVIAESAGRLQMSFYPYVQPIAGAYTTCYCEVFIHSAVNLKGISLSFLVNNVIASSSIGLDDSVDVDNLEIPSTGLKLLLKTPLFLNPAGTVIKQVRAVLTTSLFANGEADISLGRCVIL